MAVLFDLDGTIIGNRRSKTELRTELAKKYGVPEFKAKEYYDVFRDVVRNNKVDNRVPVFERLVNDKEIAKQMAEEYSKISLEHTFLYRDAEEALQEIECVKGLVTDGPRLTQWNKIREFDLEKYFDYIVVSGEVGISKPSERIFEVALESLEASPEESLYVGNVPELDVAGAKNAGLISVLINRDDTTFKRGNPNTEPDYEIKDMRDLYGIIESEKIT